MFKDIFAGVAAPLAWHTGVIRAPPVLDKDSCISLIGISFFQEMVKFLYIQR